MKNTVSFQKSSFGNSSKRIILTIEDEGKKFILRVEGSIQEQLIVLTL
jgi:hypothetical protein